MSEIHDLEELKTALSSGRRFEYVFFSDAGRISDPPTSACLSQWGTIDFESGGFRFRSSEQAMMHGKALLFGDLEMAERILSARTPFRAKTLGAMVRGFSEEVWVRERFRVVVEANLPKFATNPGLGDFLLSTGDSILAEASPTDLVWGNGLDESDRDARNPCRWPGANLLGFALMEVRRRLG